MSRKVSCASYSEVFAKSSLKAVEVGSEVKLTFYCAATHQLQNRSCFNTFTKLPRVVSIQVARAVLQSDSLYMLQETQRQKS
jgi:hypothetical protein